MVRLKINDEQLVRAPVTAPEFFNNRVLGLY